MSGAPLPPAAAAAAAAAPAADAAPGRGEEEGALEARVAAAAAALTPAEQVQLLTGRDFWSTWPLERIGLRSMVLSDGPSGVRGPVWDERSPSLNLPSATALAAAWDPALARRYGAAAAVEARRKGVDVVLGPTINLHRSPYGGRHFEAFSEDPVLTGRLAAACVSGLQASGVAATPKHYVANDAETDRFTVDVRVGERALRELYLLAFEPAVAGAGAWAVMSAYNSVNGTTMTENDLLEAPLAREWGFDGVVVSDWTAVRSLAAASAGQDLVMPGPDGPWGDALLAAVREGRVPLAAVQRKVTRLLRLAARVGALGARGPAPLVDVEDGVAFAREAAAEGTVLLTNRGELPWDPAALASVAVIGDNAALARTQGGGSATVLPERVVSPLEGVRAALPAAEVSYALGAVVRTGLTGLPLAAMTNPVTGGAGVRVSFLDADGAALHAEDRRSTELVWFGGEAPLDRAAQVELALRWTPEHSGRVALGVAVVGRSRLEVDGRLVLEADAEAVGTDLGAALLSPPVRSAVLEVVAGRAVEVRCVHDRVPRGGGLDGALGLTLGTAAPDADPEALITEAARAAAGAEVALVVVGTNAAVESEGVDRTSLALPGRQDDLVRAVAAANPRTVVLVNAGSPVLLPWRDQVAAVLVGWFGGQESGAAVADVLLGLREPGGRLPTTWPAREEDVPVATTTPTDGVLAYEEGVHVGYRAWLRALERGGPAPAHWFGAGLGYTEVALASLDAPARIAPGEVATLRVGVVNRGARRGKQVVQVYAARPASAIDRPVRWLVGSAPVRVDAGASADVEVALDARLLAHWDTAAGAWALEPGAFELHVGTSVVDTPLRADVELVPGYG